ncbi:MAG TPA: copper resistance protein CopC [Ensifer sp.]|nr:copper resistance protein CopC [Ensifer sp.]
MWAVLALILLPTFALAHAQLITSDPADGAVVATAPATFTLTFNEPVSPITIKLARPDGSVSLVDTVRTDGPTVVVTPPAGLGNGSYALSYRVISEDGHPVGGTVGFAIGAASTSASPVATDATPRASRLMILTQRVGLYLGLFFGVGGVFALIWFGRGGRSGATVLRALLGLGLVSSGLGVGLQGLDMLAVSPGALLNAAPWRQGITASYAATLGLSAVAMLAALIALVMRGWRSAALSWAALVTVGLAVAASGHASDAEPQWLMRAAVFAHATCVAIWVGALAPLLLSLRQGGEDGAQMLAAFSRHILPVVGLLLVSGVVLAVVQVRKFEALWATDYGVVLSIKLTLLFALFAAAAVNRVFLTAPALDGVKDPLWPAGHLPHKGGDDVLHPPAPIAHASSLGGIGAQRSLSLPLVGRVGEGSASHPSKGLRRSILLEIMLVIAILVTVANWRFTPPPRALQLAARQAVAAELMSDKAMAEVRIFPAAPGPVTVTVTPMAHGADDLTVKELSVILSNPQAGIEPIRKTAQMNGEGDYVVDGLRLPVPGRWHVRVEILISDFEMTAPEGDVTIGP